MLENLRLYKKKRSNIIIILFIVDFFIEFGAFLARGVYGIECGDEIWRVVCIILVRSDR